MPLLYYTEAHWAGHCPTLGPTLCYLLNGSIVGGPRTALQVKLQSLPLSPGQLEPRPAPCSRVSVSSSPAHKAMASSPLRMAPRTSSCMFLSESPLFLFLIGPCLSVQCHLTLP